MKWVLSTMVTIIFVPKLQPLVGEYIQSEFINSLGLGIAIFTFYSFYYDTNWKNLNKAFTWTGVGSNRQNIWFFIWFF